jgi:hypothetical protein
MKKIILFLAVVTTITSCSYDGKYKYAIYNNRGELYYANFYEENKDGCVMFNDCPGVDNTPGRPTIICGDYTIKKLK